VPAATKLLSASRLLFGNERVKFSHHFFMCNVVATIKRVDPFLNEGKIFRFALGKLLHSFGNEPRTGPALRTGKAVDQFERCFIDTCGNDG
jgi:hypothetical protein